MGVPLLLILITALVVCLGIWWTHYVSYPLPSDDAGPLPESPAANPCPGKGGQTIPCSHADMMRRCAPHRPSDEQDEPASAESTPLWKVRSETGHAHRRAEHTLVVAPSRCYGVSTIFVNQTLDGVGDGSPIGFVTLVLHNDEIVYGPVRHASWHEAEATHWRICSAVHDGRFDASRHQPP